MKSRETGSRAAYDGAQADFTSGEERRGPGLGESDRAGTREREVAARRLRTVGDSQSFGKNWRRGFEQGRVRGELAQRAAGVAAVALAVMRLRRWIVALRAKHGSGAECRLEFRGNLGEVVLRRRMVIGQRDELGEDRKRGEQRRKARRHARWPRAAPCRLPFSRYCHSKPSQP
ncbi:MAG: hypothetical protein ABR929_06080 [Roseiarcus sp.]